MKDIINALAGLGLVVAIPVASIGSFLAFWWAVITGIMHLAGIGVPSHHTLMWCLAPLLWAAIAWAIAALILFIKVLTE